MSGTTSDTEPAGADGFIGRLVAAWLRPRPVMRGVLDTRPSEGRILSFMMIAGAVLYAALSLELTLIAAADPTIDRNAVSARYGIGLLLYFGIVPLLLMALAALVRLAARPLGGQGSWRDTRAAVAWSWVMTAPILFFLALPGMLATLPVQLDRGLDVVGLSFFVVALSYNVAESHRFSRVWVVFCVLGGLTVTAWSAILYLTA